MYNKKLYFLNILFIKCSLFSSQKSEDLCLKIQITDLTNQNTRITDMTVKGSIFYTDPSKDYFSFNQSHVSIFNFNQKEPIKMAKGYFLDFKEKNFFPQKAFTPENMAKLKLYLFPFDSNNQTTVYISDATLEFTLTNENKLKIKKTTKNDETIIEKESDTFFATSNNGYFGWTKTCLTICDIDDYKKASLTIDNTNGYVLDQTKDFFLESTFNSKAYECLIKNCPQENTPHFHYNFPSLLIIPFDKGGKASFINHLNHEVLLEITDSAQIQTISTKKDIDLMGKETINNADLTPNPSLLKDKENNQSLLGKKKNKSNLTKNTANQEKKDSNESKRSFVRPLKIVSFFVFTLFLISLIIKKSYTFFHVT